MKITQVNSKKVKAYEIKVGECFEYGGSFYLRIADDEYISQSGKEAYPVAAVRFTTSEVTRLSGTIDVQPVNSELHISYK